MTSSPTLLALLAALLVLACTSAHAAPLATTTTSAAAPEPTPEFPVNKFTSDLAPGALNDPVCAAAVAAVDSDATIAKCYPDTTLFFSTPSSICQGITFPGGKPDTKCFPATVRAARLIAAACEQTAEDDADMSKSAIYAAWGNSAAAHDACSTPKPAAPTTRTLAIEQVYSSHNVWQNWQWDGSAPTDEARKLGLCTDANRIFFRNIKSLGLTPTTYYLSLTSKAAFVADIGKTCGFKVPPPPAVSQH
ncbi:hypothetical protein BC828DRAFT_404457 [Blastocladiella britannica]|nr:hypothetical protein BC828DRAFT_404457 [Blastocladiella britannica]